MSCARPFAKAGSTFGRGRNEPLSVAVVYHELEIYRAKLRALTRNDTVCIANIVVAKLLAKLGGPLRSSNSSGRARSADTSPELGWQPNSNRGEVATRKTLYNKGTFSGMAGGRTRMLFRATNFKSVVSAYSTTIPWRAPARPLLLVVFDDLFVADLRDARILAGAAPGATLA